jgi:hypothetical protein
VISKKGSVLINEKRFPSQESLMRNPILLGVCVWVFVATGLLSCQSLGPDLSGVRENLQPQYLLSHLINRQSGIHTVKSFLKASINKDGESKTLKQALIVDEKQSVRLDVLGLFGNTLGVLIHKNNKTSIYDLKNSRVFLGAEAQDVMKEIIGSRFEMQELVLILLGRVPGLETMIARETYLSKDKTHYFLSTLDQKSGEIAEIEIDSSTLLPRHLLRKKGNAVLYELNWREYEKRSGQYFPLNIILNRPLQKEEVSLRFDDPLLNEELALGVFDTFVVPSTESKKDS